ncbi:hypothetical protein [Polyangium mundeleinium]|uniref:Lipoprotein n=1 Tax=Polyangium mundeleinium TaxID=2995306 RepID=A0ABT5EGU3_9BACT|nr:hypothetical protein [Polyangium mundeleinium]MDC0741028.1 hypothetical protein [Polyangium mundeleinium]
MRPSLLLALALVACGGAPPREMPAVHVATARASHSSSGALVAEPLRDPEPCTRVAELVRIERVPETENDTTLTPDSGFGHKSIHFAGSLNGDRFPDLIIYYNDTCGSTHECMCGVYLGCGNGEYLPVWGPEYAFELQVTDTETANGYRLIRHISRAGEMDAIVVDLHFDGQSYQPVPQETPPRP